LFHVAYKIQFRIQCPQLIPNFLRKIVNRAKQSWSNLRNPRYQKICSLSREHSLCISPKRCSWGLGECTTHAKWIVYYTHIDPMEKIFYLRICKTNNRTENNDEAGKSIPKPLKYIKMIRNKQFFHLMSFNKQKLWWLCRNTRFLKKIGCRKYDATHKYN